ncbi:MAG: ABC transporter ATP-binding protein [Beduini sp.]|uniref:ABC transporter ATP-binding protein n=1 Tax=Beduini sp. TaxID=1922300 RepID=UPI0039A16D08
MKVLKRAFSYAFHVKFLIVSTIVLVSILMVVDILPTRLTQQLLDDYVSGIEKPWYKVDSKAENGVEVNDSFYVQQNLYKGDANIIEEACVIEVNKTLYMIDGVGQIESGMRQIDGNTVTIATTDQTYTYQTTVLSGNQSRLLYGPLVKPVIFLLVMLGAMYFLNSILVYVTNYLYSLLALKLSNLMRYDMFEKLQRLPINYFQNEADGRIVSKITNDTETIKYLYNVVITMVIEGLFKFIIIYFAMYVLNPQFAIMVLFILPLIVVWILAYRYYTNKYATQIRALNSQINATLNENIKGMKVIQAFNQEKFIYDEFDDLNKSYFDYRVKQTSLNVNVGGPVFGLFRRVTQIMVICFFGYKAVYTGEFATYGVMYAFVTYLGNLLDPIDLIMESIEMLEDAMVSGTRVFEFLDLPEETVAYDDEIPPFNGEVEFSHLDFKYNETAPYVLKDINFKAEAHQTVAFVGHTGSGKTTTMSLLMRFYDYSEGSIKIDGRELNTMSKQAFRKHVGMVLQDPILFKGTIKSNISLNDEQVTDQMVLDAMHAIGADEILNKYEHGIDTPIANLGENLSTGERQLLSFARAMLYDPSILILDEATANIDTQTEQMIQRALAVASENRTTFIVAHRLSTIKHADQIIVLDGGKIIEMGTHDELIALGGKYYQMYLSQSNVAS